MGLGLIMGSAEEQAIGVGESVLVTTTVRSSTILSVCVVKTVTVDGSGQVSKADPKYKINDISVNTFLDLLDSGCGVLHSPAPTAVLPRT